MLPDSLLLVQLIKGLEADFVPYYRLKKKKGFMDLLNKILEGTHLKATI